MTITREDVKDLRPGDVVELHDTEEGWTVTGAVWQKGGYLCCGTAILCYSREEPIGIESRTLKVVSRAPRPLYVNSDRTEPVAGDIVRDRDGFAWQHESGRWYGVDCSQKDLSQYGPLTLLWDAAADTLATSPAESAR